MEEINEIKDKILILENKIKSIEDYLRYLSNKIVEKLDTLNAKFETKD